MAYLISGPTRIKAHGEPTKTIEEFVGRVNSKTSAVSVARMISPSGWSEPGQKPEFDEFTIVLRGELQAETANGTHRVPAGQALVVSKGEWVRYSSPGAAGAEYISVCLPAFSPDTVHRDSA
jgi:mannose-6-phosphate isomerase-like protein (cupin superfamily)